MDLHRTGGMWRVRSDGSRLQLYARGFRNPAGGVSVDAYGNLFLADDDVEDGSRFEGCRLIHALEEADYGWRATPGAPGRPDEARSAVGGELPGRMPPMVKTGRGAPGGVAVYNGVRFPEVFRGLIVYPDPSRRSVLAYRVERAGGTFAVTEQFTLLEATGDERFRPCGAAVGPDGAIYLCDRRTEAAGAAAGGAAGGGRIWRLTWAGSPLVPDAPAIARGPMGAWAAVRKGTDAALARMLLGQDRELAARAAGELAGRGKFQRAGLRELALSPERPAEARVAALAALGRAWDAELAEAVRTLLSAEEVPAPPADVRRVAADLLGGAAVPPADAPELARAAQTAARDQDPSVARSAALAWASLSLQAAAVRDLPTGAAANLTAALALDTPRDLAFRDGLLRAIERLGPGALSELAELAVDPKPLERETVIGFLEGVRTAEGMRAIRYVFENAGKGKFAPLSAAHRARLERAVDRMSGGPATVPSR